MHTPGPWEFNPPYKTGDSGDLAIAIVKGRFIAEVAYNDDEQVANARLIAAAPDLLAALPLVRQLQARRPPG